MKSRRQNSGGGGGGEGNETSSKMERKDVEKNRRLHMKGLCLKLSSLIPAASSGHHHHRHRYANSPPSSSKDAITQLDQLDSAAAYIKQLKGRIEELKRRKKLAGGGGGCCSSGEATGGATAAVLPVIEVRCQDAALDVVLVSEAGKPFKLHEVITVVEQEGAEVVSASFSVVGDKIFYTVHSQAISSRIGMEASRVSQRLHGLAAGATAAINPDCY